MGYTFKVLFHHLLKTDYEITSQQDYYERYPDAKFCYAPRKIGDGLFFKAAPLLFSTAIEEQPLRCFDYKGIPALFPVHSQDSDLPFDPFAASFFCLSRYEEYLPHITDIHGRFPAHESVAFKNEFLHLPIVDKWALLLADMIQSRYPDQRFQSRYFDFEDTIDIDSAYSYKNKGAFRTVTGMMRDLFVRHQREELGRRMRVITNKEPDPYDTFDFIIETHLKHPGLRLKFFPLLGDYNVYDKNITHLNREFRELLQHLCDYAKMGIHTSYAAHDNPKQAAIERQRLDAILHRKTKRNRYHFLRLTLPKSYDNLIDNDILHDYTMGYAEEPGFRAGTGSPYPFYNLENDCETPLTIHPFVIMDTTLKRYKGMDLQAVRDTYRQFLDAIKAVEGHCCCLWHNQNFCECEGWEGWRDIYTDILDYADKLKNQRRDDTAALSPLPKP